MKHIYYYIPPCPKCGSMHTGRYVKQPRRAEDARYMMEQSLKHGELIRFTYIEPLNNAFCEDCGYEWPQPVRTMRMTRKEIMNASAGKDTMSRYADFVNKNPKKKKTIFGKIFGLLP